jgi:lipopolysaccharide biosynthesis glycosyltransferase
VSKRYTAAAYYRLILTELLPQYDKVIYMDCDIIVRNDLARLYRTIDLDDYYMAGVFEATLDFQEKETRAVGCEPGQYINSGFLIMNLAKLRRDNIMEISLQTLKDNVFRFPDQDTINIVCKGRILALKPYYNSIRTFFIPEYKAGFLRYYSETDWETVQRHGTIHYTGNKPWKSYAVKFEVWWKYYRDMPGFIKQEMKKDITYWKLLCYSHFFNSYVGRYVGGCMKYMRRNVR